MERAWRDLAFTARGQGADAAAAMALVLFFPDARLILAMLLAGLAAVPPWVGFSAGAAGCSGCWCSF